MPALRPILALLCLCGSALQAGHPGKREGRWVSASWVARALALKADDDDAKAALVREFENAHPRESFADEPVVPILDISQVDLDGDERTEIVLFVGNDSGAWSKSVFFLLEKSANKWRIRHEELVEMKNEDPRWEVLGKGGTHPTLMLSRWEAWGTGAWLVVRRFYQFKNHRLRKALETIEDSNEAILGQPIGGEATTSDVHLSGDDLFLAFSYSFFAGPGLLRKAGLTDDVVDRDEGLTLLEGKAEVRYEWDARRSVYRLASSTLNGRQIDCFRQPGEEAFVASAFGADLSKAESTATGSRRAALRVLLGLKP